MNQFLTLERLAWEHSALAAVCHRSCVKKKKKKKNCLSKMERFLDNQFLAEAILSLCLPSPRCWTLLTMEL
jgi:hypothetical protein